MGRPLILMPQPVKLAILFFLAEQTLPIPEADGQGGISMVWNPSRWGTLWIEIQTHFKIENGKSRRILLLKHAKHRYWHRKMAMICPMFEMLQTASNWFLSSGHPPGDAMAPHYDTTLVTFSVLVAILASYTAFLVTERVSEATAGLHRLKWLIAGSACLGGGIWAMHFMGMLALTFPQSVGYDPLLTIGSVIPAIIVGIVFVSPRKGTGRSPRNFYQDSMLMGAGIGAMHYLGMAAMQQNAIMQFDPFVFTISIIVAVAGSALSLQLKMRAERTSHTSTGATRSILTSALTMGLVISATHYTAMSGTHFILTDSAPPPVKYWPQDLVADIIGIGTGIILLLLVSAVLISRRLELASMLEASETQQRATLDSVAEGIITIDEQGLIRSFNRGAENIFCYSADEVVGKNVSVLMPEDLRPEHEAYTRDSTLNSARVIDKVRDLLGQKKDGSTFPAELSVTPMQLRGKRYFIGVLRDISERKNYEINLLKAKEEAELGNRAKSDFLASMSHELRTPLNAILGFAQFLKYDPQNSLNEEQTARVENIIKGGDYLLELIKQVLELNTIEAGKVSLTIDRTPPRAVIDDCLAMVRVRAAENEIDVFDQTAIGDMPLLWTDEVRLKQALLNILSNAVKYNHKGGKVTVSCELRPKKMFRLIVTDTGPGIAKELQENLFEPFERLGREAGQIEGTGIGLSITKKIVEVLGGNIDFTSEQGVGSSFWIDIPMIEKRDSLTSDIQSAKMAFTPAQQAALDKSVGTVLYIDDNPECIKSMEAIVRRIESTKFITAHDWQTGSDIARQTPLDLIIINVDLPGLSGVQSIEKHREAPNSENTPILAVTAIATAKEIETGIKAGIQGYLKKPLQVKESVAIIDEILATRQRRNAQLGVH